MVNLAQQLSRPSSRVLKLVDGRINLTSNKTPMFEFELETQVPDIMSPVNCFNVTCALSEVDVNLLIDVEGEKLFGRFNCPIEECLLVLVITF